MDGLVGIQDHCYNEGINLKQGSNMNSKQVSQESLRARFFEVVDLIKNHRNTLSFEGPNGLYDFNGSTLVIAETYSLLSVVHENTGELLYQVVHYKDKERVEFRESSRKATVFDFFNFGEA